MLMKDYTSKLLNLENVIITNVENISDQLHIYIELLRSKHTCPACGGVTDCVHDYRMQTIKDVPLARDTFLHLRKHRYRCSCGKRFLTLWKFHGQTVSLKAVIIKPKSSNALVTVCVTSIISESVSFSVIHKNRAGVHSDTILKFFYFGSTPTIDIEPK